MKCFGESCREVNSGGRKGKAIGIRKVDLVGSILVTKGPKGQGSEGVEIVVGCIIIIFLIRVCAVSSERLKV